MNYANNLAKDDLELLMKNHNSSCMSIFMPTHQIINEAKQDQIRLKNILQQAEHKLIETGVYTSKLRETLLKPVHKLAEQDEFWRQKSQGLAIFISQDIFEYYKLPVTFEEIVVINNRFHIKPLFPLFKGDGKFYILALSKNNVRFLEATKYDVKEVHLKGLPANLDEVLQYDDLSSPTSHHFNAPSGGGGGSTHLAHGQIVGEDAAYGRKKLLQYFYQINDSIAEVIYKQNVPLVLACVEEHYPIYREANSYSHIADRIIKGNPDMLSDYQLHQIALEIVEPIFSQAENQSINKFNNMISTNKDAKWTSYELEDIIPASYYGQIDTLFIAKNSQQWGNFDPDNNTIYLNKEEKIGNQDLLDFAATQTFINGGKVYVLPVEQMPGKNQMAALFRYPSSIRTSLTIR